MAFLDQLHWCTAVRQSSMQYKIYPTWEPVSKKRTEKEALKLILTCTTMVKHYSVEGVHVAQVPRIQISKHHHQQ